MRAHTVAEPSIAGSRVEAVLTWLGGGDWRELGERHEQSTHAVAGVVVVLHAALAWLVVTLVIAESVRWPVPAILPLSLIFGLLVGAITRAIASGPLHGWRVGRGLVAVAVGVVVGELAALVVFSGSIDRRLDEQAARAADSTPAVAQASDSLQPMRNARTALDEAVGEARTHRDEALVIARCEYNPTPACPQTRITGVPGTGPETRTANELLADTQRELDSAVAARDRRAPELDSQIGTGTVELAKARQAAIANADRGIGARWIVMGGLTSAGPGALVLWLLTIAFFVVVSLLPLILQLWRGETTHDRRTAARAERERAELEADTAIAVKRAQVRAVAETMWAEQQLAQARLAVEAQTEIDRVQQCRRVAEMLARPAPIAAEAEAASLAAAELSAGYDTAPETANLPAAAPATPVIQTIPEVTKAAARWIRPLVPTFVARAIDNTTQPLRTARQVFEEVEEITFSLKRTRKVSVNAEGTGGQPLESVADYADYAEGADGVDARKYRAELAERGRPAELRGGDGPRQLPPAK